MADSSLPGALPPSEFTSQGLTVFSMTEIVPDWAIHFDGSAHRPVGSQDAAGRCIVLMDADLLGERDLDWIASVEEAIGPVIAVGPANIAGAQARSQGVRGSVPRSILTAPRDLALDILSDLVEGPAVVPGQMERFMRDAIHEFRTPLTVISEFASLCQDGVGGPLTERQQTYMDFIQAAVGRMGEHFDDFRDGVRMRFGSLQHGRDRGFLPEVMRSVAGSMELAEADTSAVAGVRLAHVDCDRLTEALKRVMAGARKLSANGSQLAVSATPSGSTTAEIRVSYRGVVLSGDDVLVMEQGTTMGDDGFYRSVARVFGLGVSMARLFLEQSGGHLRLETEPGVGGAFVATVPVELSAEITLAEPDWASGVRSGAA